METYSFLRGLADSWALLALFAFFVGAILWAWRPGSRRLHEDAGRVPFRHEERPAAAEGRRDDIPLLRSGAGGDACCGACGGARHPTPEIRT